MFEGGLEFPRMVYMTRQQYKSVKNMEEFEKAVNEGYIPWDDLIKSERGLFQIPPHAKFVDIYKPKQTEQIEETQTEPVVKFGVEDEKSQSADGMDDTPIFDEKKEVKRRGRKPKVR